MNLHFGYRPGCIGRITQLHADYYAKTAGFGLPFESKVASELAQFCQRLEPQRDGLWLALEGDAIHGAIAIDGSQHQTRGAHLRWFITSDEVRGRGMGTLLLGAALAFCESHGYRKIDLWTFEGLDAARHLYEKHGFRLARSQRGSQWGKEMNEQMFVRESPLS
jgi:GNAT superfamily N-acetyltransferase